MSVARPHARRLAGPGLLLVLLALVSQLILPPGVMPAAGHDVPVVLCTGHGPASFAPTTPGDRERHGGGQHACPFAHHGLASNATHAPTITVASARYDLVASPLPAGLSHGRGLAAPPPPSHAPPLHLRA